jgi:hypothetical protein
MTDKEALRMALKALEAIGVEFVCSVTHHRKKDQHGGLDDCPNQVRHEKAITAIKQALAASVQEPVGYVDVVDGEYVGVITGEVGWEEKLYTTPPSAQRPWVGLTEQERNAIEDYCEMIVGKPVFEAIEAKLKEKNT